MELKYVYLMNEQLAKASGVVRNTGTHGVIETKGRECSKVSNGLVCWILKVKNIFLILTGGWDYLFCFNAYS